VYCIHTRLGRRPCGFRDPILVNRSDSWQMPGLSTVQCLWPEKADVHPALLLLLRAKSSLSPPGSKGKTSRCHRRRYLVLRRYTLRTLVQGSRKGCVRRHTSQAMLIRLKSFFAELGRRSLPRMDAFLGAGNSRRKAERFRLRDGCPLWCAVPHASTIERLCNFRWTGHGPGQAPYNPGYATRGRLHASGLSTAS
jgi:hypothetical protein